MLLGWYPRNKLKSKQTKKKLGIQALIRITLLTNYVLRHLTVEFHLKDGAVPNLILQSDNQAIDYCFWDKQLFFVVVKNSPPSSSINGSAHWTKFSITAAIFSLSWDFSSRFSHDFEYPWPFNQSLYLLSKGTLKLTCKQGEFWLSKHETKFSLLLKLYGLLDLFNL